MHVIDIREAFFLQLYLICFVEVDLVNCSITILGSSSIRREVSTTYFTSHGTREFINGSETLFLSVESSVLEGL
jgi:hypothetical protein